MPGRFAFIFALLLSSVVVRASTAPELQPRSRLEILRTLMSEYGTLRAPLPNGDKGLIVRSTGAVDRERLQHEVTQNGTALRTGTVVQITQIQFKDKEIVLEINGGGKKKQKWYEHIQVGMGAGEDTTPITNPNDPASGPPKGSVITLAFPGKLPDLTPDQLKDYLAPVLDFEAAKTQTLTLTASHPITPEFEKAIEERRAEVGMDEDMVRAALGLPDHKVRETKDGEEQEDWVYETSPLRVIFVTFEGDKVVSVKEYHGGPRGETQVYPEEPPL